MSRSIVVASTLAVFAALGFSSASNAQSARQEDKNQMRNLGIGLGAAALIAGTHGDKTGAIIPLLK